MTADKPRLQIHQPAKPLPQHVQAAVFLKPTPHPKGSGCRPLLPTQHRWGEGAAWEILFEREVNMRIATRVGNDAP
eukprot:365287-Chlamydomonas_euryale.AAC.4